MSVRFTAKARRGMIALTCAAGMAVSVVGCGGGGDDGKEAADFGTGFQEQRIQRQPLRRGSPKIRWLI